MQGFFRKECENMADFVPRFNWLKTKMQNYLREDYYFDILLQTDIDMFTYTGLPAGLDPVWLEKYLIIGGSIGLVRSGDDFLELNDNFLVAPAPARCGELDQYGDGTDIVGATNNGKPVQGKIGKDAVIIYNRSDRLPELDNMVDAAALMEIDRSCSINVKFSRIAPVYSCSNDNTRKGLENLLSEIIEGSVKTIASENLTDGLLPENGTQLLDITEPEKIQYIQYLTQYYDAVIRRHYNRRGLQIRTGTKAAQQSSAEIFGFDAISWVLPLARLQARQDGFKEFNRVFGQNVQVSFSPLWAQEYEAYQLRTLQLDAQKEGEVNEQTASDDSERMGDADSNQSNDNTAAERAAETDGRNG